jgi:signal transduction histidine kinase
MLRAGALDEAGQRHALDVIDRNVQSLSTLIDDLLDLARITSGRMRFTFETCDLARVVEDAVETVRPAAAAKLIAAVVVVKSDVLPVQGAPDRLRQVVWNLLTNAVKFTPAGGEINVTLMRAGLNVHLIVADTGTGIGADVLPHVFEAFRQEDSSTTRAHEGLGLGLALVKHIVELHGGAVRAESAGRDAGATFTVTLPIAFDPDKLTTHTD